MLDSNGRVDPSSHYESLPGCPRTPLGRAPLAGARLQQSLLLPCVLARGSNSVVSLWFRRRAPNVLLLTRMFAGASKNVACFALSANNIELVLNVGMSGPARPLLGPLRAMSGLAHAEAMLGRPEAIRTAPARGAVEGVIQIVTATCDRAC